MTEPGVKLKGVVIWLDLNTGDRIDMGPAERAILRSDRVAMDLNAGAGVYSVILKRVKDSRFEGTWTCRSPRKEENGVASCTLDEKDDYFLQSGEWSRGRCHWFAKLDKVGGF